MLPNLILFHSQHFALRQDFMSRYARSVFEKVSKRVATYLDYATAYDTSSVAHVLIPRDFHLVCANRI